ncbi:MAG: DUF1538 domain-containing protein [Pseudomonadota bacterium]
METLQLIFDTLLATLRDVLPIALVIFFFQLFVIRRPVANLRRVLAGFGYVVLGLSLFLIGLEKALFPLGKMMAEQLTAPEFVSGSADAPISTLWSDYLWVYAFGGAIGFATALAEPSLIAVAIKAGRVSGGAISVWGLRIAVALGAATGITVGALRIVTGVPLHYIIIGAYILVIVQTFLAPRLIIPLAYDSGGVTTSTVTVPIVTALGLGLASTIPGRSPWLDGFGMIATTCLFPIISVMAYAQLSEWRARRNGRRDNTGE